MIYIPKNGYKDCASVCRNRFKGYILFDKTFVNSQDFKHLARRKLPRPVFDYIDGGSQDEEALKQNLTTYSAFQLRPRICKAGVNFDQTFQAIGAVGISRLFLAPVGALRLLHPDAEEAVIRACALTNTGFTLSTVGTTSIERATKLTRSPLMFQMYLQKDRGANEAQIDLCKDNGISALCLTVDATIGGKRERDIRNAFRLNYGSKMQRLLWSVTRPSWSVRMRQHPTLEFPNIRMTKGTPSSLDVSGIINHEFESNISWKDVAWIAERWNGPLYVKGILHPEDGVKAISAGASGIYVSNHGGRQLDGAISPLECLEDIRNRLGSAANIIMDGGIRRGQHILKAMALGADACGIGRPYAFALAANGYEGVKKLVEILLNEINRDLKLMGVVDVRDLGAEHVRKRKIKGGS